MVNNSWGDVVSSSVPSLASRWLAAVCPSEWVKRAMAVMVGVWRGLKGNQIHLQIVIIMYYKQIQDEHDASQHHAAS